MSDLSRLSDGTETRVWVDEIGDAYTYLVPNAVPYVRLDAVEDAVRRELRGDLTDDGVESVVAAVMERLDKERS